MLCTKAHSLFVKKKYGNKAELQVCKFGGQISELRFVPDLTNKQANNKKSAFIVNKNEGILC